MDLDDARLQLRGDEGIDLTHLGEDVEDLLRHFFRRIGAGEVRRTGLPVVGTHHGGARGHREDARLPLAQPLPNFTLGGAARALRKADGHVDGDHRRIECDDVREAAAQMMGNGLSPAHGDPASGAAIDTDDGRHDPCSAPATFSTVVPELRAMARDRVVIAVTKACWGGFRRRSAR